MENKFLPAGFVLNSPEASYIIVKPIGAGGFGITYLATTTLKLGNINTEVKVAIKELFLTNDCERKDSAEVTYSKPAAERMRQSKTDFIAEAQRLRKIGIEHPNIVKVNEVFEANNTAYYVMEYLEGYSLRSYVEKHGPLSTAETIRIMRPVIRAVDFLHLNHITHLDIKPDNIMLKEQDDGSHSAVLIDFGLSKHYNDDSTPTSTINTLGYSEGYSPIEQYAGIRTFSPASDIYSLGATLYFCLTGKTPPNAPEIETETIRAELRDVTTPAMAEAVCLAMQMRAKGRPKSCNLWLKIINRAIKNPEEPYTRRTKSNRAENTSDETKITEVIHNEHDETPIQSAVSTEYATDPDTEFEQPTRSLLWLWIILGILVVGGCGLGIYKYVYQSDKKTDTDIENSTGNYVVGSDGTILPDANSSGNSNTAGALTISSEEVEEEILNVAKQTEIEIVDDISDYSDDVTTTNNNVSTQEEDSQSELSPAPNEQQTQNDNMVYALANVEQKPSYKGGDAAMFKWLNEHIQYPPGAAEEGVSGKVLVQFVVSKSGKVSDVKVVRGKHPALDNEAIRVVSSMPTWNPGRQNGQPVNVTYILPVNFSLKN